MNKLCLLGAAALIATAFLPDVASAQRGGGGMRGGGGGGLPRWRDGRRFPGRWDGWRFSRGCNRRRLSGRRDRRGGFRGAAIGPGFRGGIGGGGFRSAAIGGFRGGAISRGGFRGGGSPAPASAAQFAWPASVVVAFVGAGAGWGLPLAGLGLGLGYYGYSSYYSDPCVVWDGYTWVDACY